MELDPGWLNMPMVLTGGSDAAHTTRPLRSHTHTGFEITFVEEGKIHWILEKDQPFCFGGGDISLVQPGVLHQGESRVLQPAAIHWLIIDPLAENAEKNTPFTRDQILYIHKKLSSFGNASVRSSSLLAELFQLLRECMESHLKKSQDPLLPSQAQMLASQIVIETVRAFEVNSQKVESDPVRQAMELMISRLEEKLSMPEIAAKVGLGASRFYAVFKKEIGQTPVDYLQQLRCERAREYLANTDETITNIAFRLGFSSSQYFADCFRRHIGQSPSEFRNNQAISK